MESVYFEILHHKTSSVYSYHEEILEDSELFQRFQNSDNPEELGFEYQRKYQETDLEE